MIPVTKSWGEGDGIEGGLAALNVSRELCKCDVPTQKKQSPKNCSWDLRKCLLPAQRAPGIHSSGFPPSHLAQGWLVGGVGVHKSYYQAYKRGKRVCPHCEEGN